MNIEAIAKLLRDIQREHGTLLEGTCIIGPEWMPDDGNPDSRASVIKAHDTLKEGDNAYIK